MSAGNASQSQLVPENDLALLLTHKFDGAVQRHHDGRHFGTVAEAYYSRKRRVLQLRNPLRR